jgi:hypothetical protein
MTRADWFCVVFAMVLLPLLYWQFWQLGGPGQRVQIISEDRTVAINDLDQSRTLKVHGRLGDSVLQIKDGQVRFVASPCTNKYCIHSGWLHRSGEIAACLPNGVLVQVLGGSPRYDAINY